VSAGEELLRSGGGQVGIVSGMANPEHLAKLKQGVEAWNEWRKRNPEVAVDLSGANLREANLGQANLRKANLSGAGLTMANLSGSSLQRAELSAAILRWANLTRANLSEANLKGATLREAYLFEANLRGAELRAAILGMADFSWANLGGADLTEADLSGANLREATLIGVKLGGSDLSNADLSGANLREANLGGAEISGSRLGLTVFANTDLSGVKGLELCVHEGPSTIGIDTIFRSKGEIPDVFLRGCGVPEQFITYARSLVSQGIEFYSCFISYSTRDQEFAERLHADLQNKAVRCWFAPHDIQGGRKIHEQIDEAIRVYDRLLLILSEESMKSSWVDTEIAKARKRESKEGRQMLFPVRLVDFETLRDWECFDADTGKDSAREIREYFIPDFSRWKDHDSYKKAFDRLLKDLTAKDGKRT
jgi:uncharacterized protein YjbI with pentapeptide repeats